MLSLCALQIIQEYVAFLKLGHTLVFEAPDAGDSPPQVMFYCSLTTDVRYWLLDGTVKAATISLIFPASSGTVVRVMDSWYAARGELLAIRYLPQVLPHAAEQSGVHVALGYIAVPPACSLLTKPWGQ